MLSRSTFFSLYPTLTGPLLSVKMKGGWGGDNSCSVCIFNLEFYAYLKSSVMAYLPKES